jgi:hypothetical protein
VSEHEERAELDARFAQLTEEEASAAAEAIKEVRAQHRRDEKARQIWQPVCDELGRIDVFPSNVAMARRLIERTRLCGWNEDNDGRLTCVAGGLVALLELSIGRDRRTGNVTVNGQVIREDEGEGENADVA